MKQRIFHIIITLTLCLMTTVGVQAELFNRPQTPAAIEQTAREYFRQDKWAEGKKVLDDAWRDYGTMSSLNELMGRYYFHYKKYDRARFFLVRSLRDDKSNNLARELLVSVEELTKNYSSAICYINELLEANPYSLQLWRRKINIYREQGNTEEANRLLTRLQQIYPADPVVKKDVTYISELRLAKQKKANDVNGQIETLTSLVNANPKHADYYNSLANALLQAGRIGEAEEVLGRGARLTGNTKLMIQRASMLSEQGKYIEALNYLKECNKKHPSADIQSVINQTEKTAAENAQMNDPYTAMAKVYSSQHSKEALNYLLNTSLARGYYEDALMYIREAKKIYGEKEDILYREFLVHRRLGNKGKAMAILQKLFDNHAKNADVAEYLSEMRYESAATMMGAGLYADAIEDLEFAEANTYDDDLRRHCTMRLFNCYLETHRFEQANEKIELLKKKYNYANYPFQKAALLKSWDRIDDALKVLADAYGINEADDKYLDDSYSIQNYMDRQFFADTCGTKDPMVAQLLAFQYEEYAMPYIRYMIDKGMIHQANRAVKKALRVCPTSNELLHEALTTSDILRHHEDFSYLVSAGRTRYPGDPFFIVKEAEDSARAGNYDFALGELRPELDNFLGDTAVVQCFADCSEKLAMIKAKNRDYGTALELIDTALVFKHMDHHLLLAKGQIYEMMHEYDSAYVYQQNYKPTLMDYREHSHHLEELMGQQYKNEINVDYMNGRGGEEDHLSANVEAGYTRHEENTDFSASIGYTSRDGMAIPYGIDDTGVLTKTDDGGAAVRIGVDVMHSLKDTPWSIGAGAFWGSKYYPQMSFKAIGRYTFNDSWSAGVHGGYKRLKAFATKNLCEDYKSLGFCGIEAEKIIGQFRLNGLADAYFADGGVYVSGALHGEFYPITGSRTKLYAEAGAGNAPQQWQIDNNLPCGFGKLGTYVRGGLTWMFNRCLSANISGTWYSSYRGQDLQLADYSLLTTNRNLFYINGGVNVRF